MFSTSPSAPSFFSLPWSKPSGTQSEYGVNDQEPSAWHWRDGRLSTTSAWPARRDTQRRGSERQLASSNYFTDVLVANNSRLPSRNYHPKAQSTLGTVTTTNNQRAISTRAPPDSLRPHTRNPSHISVQETLLASLFQKQHKTSRRRNREFQAKHTAATECDPADLRERNRWEDSFVANSRTKEFVRDIPKNQHIYAQSEYNDGAYETFGQRQRKQSISTVDEVEDGLNEWGLPKLLVATHYEGEPVVDDENDEDLDQESGSDSIDSFMKRSESVTFQQIVNKFSKPKYASSNATMVDHTITAQTFNIQSSKTPAARAHKQFSSRSDHIITFRTLGKFVSLVYILCMISPVARSKAQSFLTIYLQRQNERSRLLTWIMIKCLSFKKLPKKIKSNSTPGIAARPTNSLLSSKRDPSAAHKTLYEETESQKRATLNRKTGSDLKFQNKHYRGFSTVSSKPAASPNPAPVKSMPVTPKSVRSKPTGSKPNLVNTSEKLKKVSPEPLAAAAAATAATVTSNINGSRTRPVVPVKPINVENLVKLSSRTNHPPRHNRSTSVDDSYSYWGF